jgi:mRNA interferase RelE/StbE
MKITYSRNAREDLVRAPAPVRKAFYKQAAFLIQDLHHPSIRAKKYNEANDIWQGRVNRNWRFYFKVQGEEYFVTSVIPHPK